MEEDPAVKGGRIGGPKGGRASLHSEKVSAAQIQMYLKGINYPADKEKLIQTATMNRAPDNVLNWFRKLPDRQYDRANNVEEEFGRLK